MSAFLVGKPHIDHLVRVAIDGPAGRHPNWRIYWFTDDGVQQAPDDPNLTGRLLWIENHKSIAARYPGNTDCPITEIEAYVYARPRDRLSTVAALKALDCYEYQSCEHPEWPTSAAFSLCYALRKRLISALPGYDDAAWEICQ